MLLIKLNLPKKKYEYAIVLGSTFSNFLTRLAKLLRIYNEGTRFKKLIIHTGARPLDPTKESKNILFNHSNGEVPIRKDWQPTQVPLTEADMVRMVLDRAELPAGFKDSVKIDIIDAPMQKNKDGSLRRPNTGDVVKLWLSQGIQPGTVLAITNQPYVLYQHAVLKTLLPTTFNIETAGSAIKSPIHVGIILDSLARWLYQENQYQQVQR